VTEDRKLEIYRSTMILWPPSPKHGRVIPAAFHLFLTILFLVGPFGLHRAGGAEERAGRIQGQMEVTVIHVDKFGVYVPDIVFYWDSSLNKQKIAALTAAAERLRNKRAVVTYSAQGSPLADKRPLVLDIAPYQEPALSFDNGRADEDPTLSPAEKTASGAGGRWEAGAEPFPARDIVTRENVSGAGQEVWGHDAPSAEDLPETSSQVSVQSLPIQKRDALMLVEHLLHLTGKKALDSILYYYADSVNYYGRGDVDKDYIRRDLNYYFRNWDRIRSSLEGDIQLLDTSRPDVKVVRFQSSYEVENAKRSITGMTDNTWKIQRTRTGLKVVDQKQTILSSHTVEKP